MSVALGRLLTAIGVLAGTGAAFGQEPAQPQPVHSHAPDDPVTIFPTREASGTAWLPRLTPMSGVHGRVHGWELMLHGDVFAQFLYESGEVHRRSHQAGSINWMMGMARRPVGEGRLGLRAMVSLEPWTIPGCGYPDLLATGEVCDGDTIHDRQHPHDLFMEAAVEYDRPLKGPLRWQVYAGPAGEPALGPPAFPHRQSAFANPIAPISHHWLDATHITFGVVTAGVYGRRWKAEGSAFNGREPDESRAGFDLAALDSVAGRLSLLATDGLALQVSAGHLREAEAGVGGQPRADVNRTTVSATYHRLFGSEAVWATTVAYGVNSTSSTIPQGLLDQTTHALLAETSATAAGRHSWFGRLEVVGKPAHDLHAHEFITSVFTVGKLQIGYVRHLKPWNGLLPGLGASASVSMVPPLLAPRYGGRLAPGFGVFLAVTPSPHTIGRTAGDAPAT